MAASSSLNNIENARLAYYQKLMQDKNMGNKFEDIQYIEGDAQLTELDLNRGGSLNAAMKKHGIEVIPQDEKIADAALEHFQNLQKDGIL